MIKSNMRKIIRFLIIMKISIKIESIHQIKGMDIDIFNKILWIIERGLLDQIELSISLEIDQDRLYILNRIIQEHIRHLNILITI